MTSTVPADAGPVLLAVATAPGVDLGDEVLDGGDGEGVEGVDGVGVGLGHARPRRRAAQPQASTRPTSCCSATAAGRCPTSAWRTTSP